MTGRMYDERWASGASWSTFVFFNLTFAPMHVLGLQGMPRRVATYSRPFADLNLFISICSWLLGLSTLIFLYNMVTSWRGGPRAVGEEPVARRSSRRLLPPAGVQLRPRADGRRRTVRVRGAGRGSRDPVRPPPWAPPPRPRRA